MSEAVLLREGQYAAISSENAAQMEAMMSLLGKDGRIKLVRAPSGYNLSVAGYTGMAFFADGSTVNFVPQIKPAMSEDASFRMLMEMLHSVFGITSSAEVKNVFEFFVRGFIDSVNTLIVRGLRSKYHLVSGNEKSFKGKIIFSEHIRRNYIHKERIYVEYENYSQNRPENRIIKTTLEVLSRKTEDNHNAKGLKNLIAHMEEIPPSYDVDKDFGTIILDRNMIDYTIPLYWCRVFLKGMGLAGASRENVPFMLILDTESLFNAYVGRMAASENENGTYQLKYTVDISNEAVTKGVSVIKVNLDWTFYDRVRDRNISDAESLYMSTPGYRVIPGYGADRIRSMAGSYLSDALV